MGPRLKASLDEDGVREQAPHLEHGGMLVRPAGEAPAPMTDVVLELEVGGRTSELRARVVGVMPDGAVALAMEDAAAARDALRPEPRPAESNVTLRIQRMSTPEKIDLAKHGDRMARMALIRDTNKAVHPYVLDNRGITPDEVRIIAGHRNVNPDALQRIAAHPEWIRDSRIVSALVANPKTPSKVALRLLDRLPPGELRRLSKAADTPAAIQRAARRKLGG